ncbi:membrane protein [Longispora fulva]|uniref:Putative membrane protein YeiH n=1 Tax=Longispora fulva TaxID=619741 RepID=A0A8J7KH35_9ACTN|nr:TRIC cation channel family protein [Longispora fulva]MBG6138030.1 putative membrane protein YeiH [Longispora fulva]GIG60283.1 membrane protein [Longispora fulva]
MESLLLVVLDLVGVAVFAASGGSAGVAKRLDLFGVGFLGLVSSLGGGIFRDLVINAAPPLAFADWRYLVVAVVASVAVFWLHPQLNRLRRTVLVLDAAGLGLFTVTGTLKALSAGVPPAGACLIGMITGIGGGMLRDVFTGEIPVVLRREVYALASLAGAIVITVASRLEWGSPAITIGAAVLVFGLRLVFVKSSWQVPVAQEREYRPLRKRRGNSAPGGRTD